MKLQRLCFTGIYLSTGRVSASVHGGIHTPPGADTPLGADTSLGQTPQEQTSPSTREDSHPLSRHPPPPEQTPSPEQTPHRQTPSQSRHSREQTPQSRHPPWADPSSRHPHPQETATATDGMHPTGMHFYYDNVYVNVKFNIMRLYYISNIGVCPVLTLDNGSVNYSQPLIEEPRGYMGTTRAYFSCNAGYVLSGTRSITCNSDGQTWNLIPPTCTKGIKIIQCISVRYYKRTRVEYIIVVSLFFFCWQLKVRMYNICEAHKLVYWTILAMYTQGFKIKILLTFPYR